MKRLYIHELTVNRDMTYTIYDNIDNPHPLFEEDYVPEKVDQLIFDDFCDEHYIRMFTYDKYRKGRFLYSCESRINKEILEIVLKLNNFRKFKETNYE